MKKKNDGIAPIHINKLFNAIAKKYPSLSHAEQVRLVEILLDEMTRRISLGENLAFINIRPDGETELTVIGLEVIDKHLPKK